MKHYLSFIALTIALLTGTAPSLAGMTGKPSPVAAADRMMIMKAGDAPGLPLPVPSGEELPLLTPKSVQDAVDEQITARFKAAAGPNNRLLTADQAKAAGWGIIADQFSQIDRDGDGYLRLEEVTSYMKARSPLATAVTEEKQEPAAAGGPVQIIE